MPNILNVDRAASALSLTCVAHCLALPVIAVSSPALVPVAEAEWVHWLLAALSILASSTVLTLAPNARTVSFILPALAGSALIVFAIFAEGIGLDETPPTVIGGLLLAGAHLFRIFKNR